MGNVPNVRIAMMIWLESFSAGSFCPQPLALFPGIAEFLPAGYQRCTSSMELPQISLFHVFPPPFWLLSATLYSISTHTHFKSLLMWVLVSLEWNWCSSSFSSASLALWRPTEWRWNQWWPACSDSSIGTLGQSKIQRCRKQWLDF